MTCTPIDPAHSPCRRADPIRRTATGTAHGNSAGSGP
jgi:hypothetical protein